MEELFNHINDRHKLIIKSNEKGVAKSCEVAAQSNKRKQKIKIVAKSSKT